MAGYIASEDKLQRLKGLGRVTGIIIEDVIVLNRAEQEVEEEEEEEG